MNPSQRRIDRLKEADKRLLIVESASDSFLKQITDRRIGAGEMAAVLSSVAVMVQARVDLERLMAEDGGLT